MDNTQKQNLDALREILNCMQNPQIQAKTEESIKLTSFRFDFTFEHLFLGFDNGEVRLEFYFNRQIGYLNLNQLRKDSLENEEEVECPIFNIKASRPISDIFEVGDNLLVVTPDKIFRLGLENLPDSVAVEEIFDTQKNADTDKFITNARYSEKHDFIYLVLNSDEEEETLILRLSVNAEKENWKLARGSFDWRVTHVELVPEDPQALILVCDKRIFEFNFGKKYEPTEQTKHRKSRIGINLHKEIKHVFSRSPSQRGHFKEIFTSSKGDKIRFCKFDKKQKHMFVNVEKTVEKYLLEKITLVQKFEGHVDDVENVLFTRDFAFMIR